MRIWYQSGVEEGKAGNYREALEAHFQRIASSTTDVRFSGVPEGTWKGLHPAQASGFPYLFRTRGCAAFLDNAIKAEREGYDAFIVGAFTEPAIQEIRASIDIPVISAFEATLLTACTVARRIGLIVPTEEVEYVVRLNVEQHQLTGRVASVRALSPTLDDGELNEVFKNPQPFLRRFEAAARLALTDYADAVVPAEGIIAEIVATHGPKQVDGAPILDAIGIPVLYAEYMHELWQRTGLRAGRRWHYRKPPQELIDGSRPSR
jgi:allantoin racemase